MFFRLFRRRLSASNVVHGPVEIECDQVKYDSDKVVIVPTHRRWINRLVRAIRQKARAARTA